MKEALDNGEEAQRLADLWNLDPADEVVETMISHLTRAILRREINDQEAQWQVQSEKASVDLDQTFSGLNVEKLFDDVNDYENKCSNLPTVPEAFDPNAEIESRLLKIKFFLFLVVCTQLYKRLRLSV